MYKRQDVNDDGQEEVCLASARVFAVLTALGGRLLYAFDPVSYTHLRAHETVLDLVCRLLLEKKQSHALHHS